MDLLVKKTYRGAAPTLLKRELAEIGREGARFMGRYWHQHFRPRHFQHEAFHRYGYQTRSRGYTRAKIRALGHAKPLVGYHPRAPWESGESERATQIEDVRATFRGGIATAHVVMRAPKLNFRRWPSSPDMRKELTTVTAEELSEITRETTAFMQSRIDLLRGGAVVTLGPERLV